MRPLLVGYLVAATSQDEGNARRCLARFAALEGFTLGPVYVDRPGREHGFYRMVQELRRGQTAAVAVPDWTHLAGVGCLAGADLRTASRYLQARLLIALDYE
jgi:hypothetical protein